MLHHLDKANSSGRLVGMGAIRGVSVRLHPRLWPVFALPALLVPLLLAGCGSGGNGTARSENEASVQTERAGARSIPCGPREADLRESCLLEVQDRAGDLHITLRRPDGGFRRLLWSKGDVLTAADGADALEVTPLNGSGVEVDIGGWRYRILRTGGRLP